MSESAKNQIELRGLIQQISDCLRHDLDGNEKTVPDFNHIRTVICLLMEQARGAALFQLTEFAQKLEVVISCEGVKYRSNVQADKRLAQLVGFFEACCKHLEMLGARERPSLSSEKEDLSSFHLRKKRVLIVDDSRTEQLLISKMVESDERLEVAGVASSGEEAMELIPKILPDVVALALNMTGTNGFEFLKQHMSNCLIPVILISAIGDGNENRIFDALYQGAIDFIPKSEITAKSVSLSAFADRIWSAANASLVSLLRFYTNSAEEIETVKLSMEKIVGIGVSIGGTRSLLDLFCRLSKDTPAMLIVQRIAPHLSKSLIQELHEVCPFVVKEAEDGEKIEPMKVLFAPQDYQMSVVNQNGALVVKLHPGAPTDLQKPSIDILFDSIAVSCGKNAVGVLFGGSDKDGAYGLLEMRKAGAYTIVQDETECVNATLTVEAVRVGAATIACWGEKIPKS